MNEGGVGVGAAEGRGRQKSRAGPPSSLPPPPSSLLPPPMDVCQFHSAAQGRGKLGKKWKYPRGAAWGSGEDERRERGSKLYSKHDVRSDRNIMAMGPRLDMERGGRGTALEAVGRVGRGRARGCGLVQVPGQHLVLDRRPSDLACAYSERTSLPQRVF